MYYYKRIDENGKKIYGRLQFPSAIGEEITEEEYNAAAAQIEAMIAARAQAAAQERADRIEELEKNIEILEEENAALLYKLLTGEDLENEE